MLRRLARPRLATAFVAEGVDAARNPGPHVDRVESAWNRWSDRLGLPEAPSRDDLTMLARAHGVATALAAGMLAVGRMPRTSALALAVLTLPRVLVEVPDPQSPDRDTSRLLVTLSLLGGALVAAEDTGGRPSLAWRVEHARVGKDAVKDARIAALEARRDARHAVDAARREARNAVKQARKAVA